MLELIGGKNKYKYQFFTSKNLNVMLINIVIFSPAQKHKTLLGKKLIKKNFLSTLKT